MAHLVIVGASYAGTQLALAARELGFDGEVTMVGEEPHAPYQRPPLSKGFLSSKIDASSLPLQSQARFDEERIVLKAGVSAQAIDRTHRELSLSDGERIRYDHLALTTGARCRQLQCDGARLAQVHYLRNLADACAIKASAGVSRRAVVVGGGFIGLEVAACLCALGLEVTVVEMQGRLLERAVPPLVSTFLLGVHEARGVTFRMGSQIARICGADAVTGIELETGEHLAADMVVAGLGVVPNVELASGCGLAVDNGIVVNSFGRTSDASIVAAGDCASYPNPWADDTGKCVRVESIQSANDLAKAAAATIAGVPAPYDAVPWFWSDQYAYKLQMAGFSRGHDTTVVRGSPDEGRFTALYLRDGRLIGADSVNRPQDHMAVRRLLAARIHPGEGVLADETVALKSLLPV
ncbi:NAD(P)/FAD-dependent oxidoreductase [Cupriavidus sp. CuC1]|uniref:NAD(P)/FAD-dependent oxidoreductase n=1 Tax=Cupriavidus sp. CuC1 TaxID=3373131 RepID=UPI0037D291EC